MTLYLHRSNDLDRLVETLAKLPPLEPPDPFEPETIVLQTRGMERWLSMRLAEARGVFAHGRFIAFDDLLHELMAALVPAERVDDWRPGQLVWRIAEVLRTAPVDPELASLAAWLQSTHATLASPSAAMPDQIVQLAWRIAEVFYRYAVHRPAMVDAWEQGAPQPGQEWQPALWRRLAARIGAPHPGRRLTTLVERLADAPLPAGFPRRLLLFGHHTMVELHVRALAALGHRMEVHLFRPAIGPGLGHDEHVRKHPLRASLGRLLDDFDALLSRHAPAAIDLPDMLAPAEATLLGRLQRALYDGPAKEDLRRPGLEPDASLQFHSCASALRQVEVLRDELLTLFAADDTLEPRDVIVMTPDIETYAPLIDAVFRDGDKDLPPDHPMSPGFPPIHRLHDLALRRTNPIAESFLAILALALGRYPVSAVLDLLTLPPVLAKAGLLEDELPRLQDLLAEARVRWGRDEHHRAREGQPETRRNTWAGGFDRLLLGHALATTGLDDFMGIVPVDDVEGKDETRTLGLFIDYAERLFDELADLHVPRTVTAWRARLSQLVTSLLVADDASAGQAQLVFDVLSELAERAERGGFQGELEFSAMRALIAEPLEARRPSVSFLSGGLTFCTLVPMRTIPFRVVCLLGMDDGAFPRSPHGLGFDLLENDRAKVPGDRSPREDDRMTFLETLLAARQHLLVTWTGYRATDKRELDAAGPVAELIESVRRGLGLQALPEPVFVAHPLQPFTPANFRKPPRSFDRRYLRGAARILAPRTSLPPHWDGTLDAPAPSTVALSDLAFSFEQPARWFCKERLRVSLVQRDLELADREPIDLDQLERWALRDKVLRWVLDAVDPEHRLRALESTGVLPLGAAGKLVLLQIEDEVNAIAERVRLLRAGAWRAQGEPPAHPDPVEVHLRLSGVEVVGQLDAVYDDARIVHQAGKLKMKSVVALWVRHLALCATLRAPAWSHIVAQDKHGVLRPVAPARARTLLTDLLALHVRARARPLCFFPATSWAWLVGQAAAPAASREIPKEARDEWRRRGFDGGDDLGDGTDAHVVLLFGQADEGFPFDDTGFMELSERVLGPLRETPDGRVGASAEHWVYRTEDLA